MELSSADTIHTHTHLPASVREQIVCLNKVIDHCGPADMDLSSSPLIVLG